MPSSVPPALPRDVIARRTFLTAALWGSSCLGVSLTLGCSSFTLRNQSPEIATLDDESAEKTRLVGDVSGPYGLNYVKVEAPGLVVGLKNTGSDPPPSSQRSQLMADMLARNVHEPNKLLASPQTSLVWVQTWLPPGAQVGDELDLEIRVPEGNETTDLSGGWLMEVSLKEMVAVNNAIHTGHVMAEAEGAVLVNPSLDNSDSSPRTKGRVLSGARVKKARKLGLVLKREDKSVFLSKQIGDALNKRFHTHQHGTKHGIANPKSDEYIELEAHPRYKHNLPRYIRVVRAVPLSENSPQRLARLELLERQLLDPITAPNAAIRLEAIGKEAVPVLRKGLESTVPEVRFYAAEALAYLDDSHAAGPLALAARDEPAFRVFALTALSTMDDIAASDELKALLDSPSAETRYGAFRALWGMNAADPAIRGEFLGNKVWLHRIASQAPALVHVSRQGRPEIVLFGAAHQLTATLSIEAGQSIIVRVDSPERIVLSRFLPGEPDQRLECPNDLGEVIRKIVEIGGKYPDVVHFLTEANRQQALNCRFEVDKLPQTGRRYDRTKHEDTAHTEDEAYEVSWALPNLFGGRQAQTVETPLEVPEEPQNSTKN
ncbi:MAG: flagellar basal body P-ring protein FlgI [Pirellulales bacterium]|nr:flagellar basal body P-ring protein FlgI [Pirellulales bacterium]